MGKLQYRLTIMATAAACLAGCGVLPQIARQTTAAAISPIASTARIVSQDLKIVSQNMAASSAATARTARQVSLSAAQARTASRAAQQRRAQAARIAKQNTAAAKKARSETANSGAAASEPFDILPAALLAQLTQDQAALQRAAQKEALTAPVGETIFWEDGGRTGSATAEDETTMGSFVCRTFVQTIQIVVTEERASTHACRTPDGIWEASLNRSEMQP